MGIARFGQTGAAPLPPCLRAEMPRQILLHLGMPRTGTASVQSALAGHDDGATRMARLGPANHALPLLTILADAPGRLRPWADQGLTAAEVEARRSAYHARLAAEMALDRERLVLSGAELSLLPPDLLRRMIAALAPHADEVRARAWLRPVAGFVASAFGQMVKAGLARPDLPRPRYRDRFEPYLQALGPGAVELHRHDPQAGAVAAFRAALGLPPAAGPEPRLNPSLPPAALRLLWAFNGTGPLRLMTRAQRTARSRLIRHLAGRHPGPPDFPAEAARTLDPADAAWAEAASGHALQDGPTGDAGAARAALLDWLGAHDPAALDRLEEDLEIIHCRVPKGASVGDKVAALHAALLDEAEAEAALHPVFRARHRGMNAALRGRSED